MWIQHKVRAGDDVATILKRYKIKDIKVLFLHPKNKSVAAALKGKGELKSGMVLFVPDPRARCYIVPGSRGKVPLTDKEYKQYLANVHRSMDGGLRQARLQLDAAIDRHDSQNEVNREFPIVAFLSSNWVGKEGDEPVSSRKAARAAFKRLEKTVTSRNYKAYDKDMIAFRNALNAYRKGIGAWLKQLIGSAENWTTGLTIVKEGSFTFVGAAAMTVAAPASTALLLATGGGVGAGTAFLSSAGNELGRSIAGEKVTPGQVMGNIATAMGKGAVFGVASAGISKFAINYVAGPIAKNIMSSGAARKYAFRFVTRSSWISRRLPTLLDTEMKALAKSGVDFTLPASLSSKALDQMSGDIIARFITRLSVGSVIKVVDQIVINRDKIIHSFLDTNATKVKGKLDENKLGQRIANQVVRNPVMDDVFAALVEGNVRKIESEICIAIRQELQTAQKAAKKKK